MYLRSTFLALLLLLVPFQKPGDSFQQHYENAEAQRRAGNLAAAQAEYAIILAEAYHKLSGIYSAQSSDKPMVVMEPFGTTDAVPDKLREFAEEVVPWNGREMGDAIRRQARHENTTRWDVIEFKLD